MERQEARELLDLRDRARAHLREVEAYVREIDAVCARVQPERVLGWRRFRRRHLRVIKAAVIGAVAAQVARKLAVAVVVPAAAAALAVSVITVPGTPGVPQSAGPSATVRGPSAQAPHGRRRRRTRVPARVAPVSRPAPSTPSGVRSPHPSPSPSRPGSPLVSASPSPPPTSPPVPSPSPSCTLNLLGICVRLLSPMEA